MPSPPVSVITIAYNAAPLLGEAIESVQAQTDDSYEYLIIDDASEDGTLELACRYAGGDERIRVLANERNLGIGDARNRGLEEARGRYIMWLDADDIALPTRLEHQRRFLDEHPEVVYVGGYLEIFSKRGTLATRRYPTDDASLRRMLHRFSAVAEPAAMLRRSAATLAGPYDGALSPAADLDMTFRLARVGKLANLPEVVTRYRISDDMATVAKMSVMARRTWEIRHRYVDDFPPTLADRAYGLAQRAAMLLPAKVKMWLLTRVRDTPPDGKVSWMNRHSTSGSID